MNPLFASLFSLSLSFSCSSCFPVSNSVGHVVYQRSNDEWFHSFLRNHCAFSLHFSFFTHTHTHKMRVYFLNWCCIIKYFLCQTLCCAVSLPPVSGRWITVCRYMLPATQARHTGDTEWAFHIFNCIPHFTWVRRTLNTLHPWIKSTRDKLCFNIRELSLAYVTVAEMKVTSSLASH